ncbi:hypothetical protein CVT25_004244 [Psilocybe cyanescens]|uniref:DNA mismatch repair proteins mutS family domain-containing protein n=1 Tax=Psilocybe cyanescens TaxID=93625 RepID=A0A409VS39_PSICY|nr:hypothetical protein CVT25_004244 [Psilocybe cyanescens]
MAITRLAGHQTCNKSLPNVFLTNRLYLTRRSYASEQSSRGGSQNLPQTSSSASKKSTRTKVKYSDLPGIYVPPSGVPSAPLKSWFADGRPEEQAPIDIAAKPARKRRSIKNKPLSDTIDDDESQTPPKAPKVSKASKPTTFLSRQILSNLKRFPHCLLLTRVGQFYESYFDQAVEISHLLNIKLTSKKWNGDRVAMCGFPILHIDKHLKTLVQQEKRFVALCEEFPVQTSPKLNVKEFERRIARIVTPGTLIDESFLNPLENNYLLAISPVTEPADCATLPEVGLAWIDVSTGEFFSKQCKLENVPDELARLAPREIVLEDSLCKKANHPIFSAFTEGSFLISYTTPPDLAADHTDLAPNSVEPASPSPHLATLESLHTADKGIVLLQLNDSQHLSAPPAEPTPAAIRESTAVNLLTKYLQDNLLEHMPRLDAPLHESAHDRMQIDLHTIQGLEIRESGLEGSSKGSLLSVIKRTTTSGGARLLARWLCSPSTSTTEINSRQSLVTFFRSRLHFRMDIINILNEVDDVGRLCQRFLLGRADFGDLAAIRTTINFWASLKNICAQEMATEQIESPGNHRFGEWNSMDALLHRLTNLDELSERISTAIVLDSNSGIEANDISEANEDLDIQDDPQTMTPVPEKEDSRKGFINPQFSEKLANLNDILQKLEIEKEKMESDLRLKYDAPSLTLRSASGQGMFIHLSRSKRDKKKLDLDPEFYSIGESLSTKSYIYRDWSQLGASIAETSITITQAEKEVFEQLSLEVIEHARELRQNAQVIDELDVAISFAVLADEMKFVRPELSEDGCYNIINGRHPSVEMGLFSSGRQFTPNSVSMDPSSNLHIITGPNMAGKSTLLRQTAVIAILAQVGSCVPADYAHISIVDKLFSRIGAKDDLFRDRSTFMVEMLETADILRRATEKSLVIMDEVGRGTTVKDGLAIAFAALHHLATINKSRCLFATHFHELAEMVGNNNNTCGSGSFHNVRFYCSDVEDAGDGHFTYSYRVRPGINRDSHGLKVARLAGIPSSAMDVAANTLSWLRENGSSNIQDNYNNFLQSTVNPIL